MLRLSCVVDGPIYGPFMGCNVTGFPPSAHAPQSRDVSCFSLKSFHFRELRVYGINRFSFHTNPYISNVTQRGRFPYFELGLPVTILACITGALRAKQGERSNSKREKNMSRESRGGEIFSPPLISRFSQSAAFASLGS